jgi:hypothetical protein
MPRPATLLKYVAIFCGVSLALVYAADDMRVSYKMNRGGARDPLETVTLYYATSLKNGKVEVYYDQPVTQVCVHSIFPHSGYTPCWYLNRSAIKRIS